MALLAEFRSSSSEFVAETVLEFKMAVAGLRVAMRKQLGNTIARL